MRRFKDYWRTSKYGDSPFKSYQPFLWDIVSVVEVSWFIDFVAIVTSSILYFLYGYYFISSALIGLGIHLSMSFTIATVSTIITRNYINKKEAQDELLKTLIRLDLNNLRKGRYASKTSI